MTLKRKNIELSNDADVIPMLLKEEIQAIQQVQEDVTRRSFGGNGVAIVKRPTTVGGVLVFGSGDTGQLGLGENLLGRKKPAPYWKYPRTFQVMNDVLQNQLQVKLYMR